ncbi:MAG TPA: pyridoxamine 5'-phosphate oxidase [Gemmatimonadales bacterium]|jgi:pyridoxamine 5'-phosphate oxidase
MTLPEMRRDYGHDSLDLDHTVADPLDQFRVWFDDARSAGIVDANAMTLATADARGRPSARVVLLKDVDATGFIFYTDYRSRKGRELEQNPRAALVVFWSGFERQVRVTGDVERVDAATSFAYFRTRPLESRLGAWASHQSAVIHDRNELERELGRITAEYAGREIPLPPHWGGFRVVPDEVEFWQGRPGRLHDRIQYRRAGNGWDRVRLSP